MGGCAQEWKRVMAYLLVGSLLAITSMSAAFASEDLTLASNFEVGFGILPGAPIGDFEELTDIGIGFAGGAGYWASDRLRVGVDYDRVWSPPVDFWSAIERYMGYDDISWTLSMVETGIQYHFVSFSTTIGEGTPKHSLFVDARILSCKRTLTVEAGEIGFEAPDSAVGYAGGLGYRLFGPRRDDSILGRGSAMVETLYYSASTEEFDRSTVILKAGISFHFGP